MPNSPASDIADFLVSQGVGTYDISDTLPLIRVGGEPDIENRVLITLYDTPGVPSNPKYQRDQPSIQVRAKAKSEMDYPSAYNAQQAVKDVILGMDRREINGSLYVGVWMKADIASLASDYNKRSILVSTYRMVREYDSDNRTKIQ